MKIIPIDPAQNIYANNACFKLVAKQNVLLESRTVQKLTYRDFHPLIWKIFQVALAALMTLMTLGLSLCFQKGIVWKKALAQFKDRSVYLNVAGQPTVQAVIPSSKKPLDAAEKTVPTPALVSVAIIPVTKSLPTPTVIPLLPLTPKQVIIPSTAPAAIAPIPEPLPSPTIVPTAPITPTPAVIPSTAPAAIAPIPAPLPAPTVVTTPVVATPQRSPADLAMQNKIKDILKENPEYDNAIKAWEKKGVSLADQVVRLEELKQYAFGTDKWVKYFGEIVGNIPPLPENIAEICNSDDPAISGTKVKDTHVLVLVPAAVMVKGKQREITLKSLGELVQAPKGGGHQTQYYSLKAPENENKPVAKSHWALMTKDILRGSRKWSFEKQVKKVAKYSEKANRQYKVPNAIDAAACCLLHFVSSGIKLFADEFPRGYTYTRCLEQNKMKMQVIVGGFSTVGLFGAETSGLSCREILNRYADFDYGIAAVQTF